MRIAILAIGGAVVLAGCQQTPPARRAGLWQETITRNGGAVLMPQLANLKVCVDSTTEARSPIFNMSRAADLAKKRNCTPPKAQGNPGGVYQFSESCPLPGANNGVRHTDGTASGDFKTTYHLHIVSAVVHPAFWAKFDSRQIDDINGRWLGPCPPGMAPGDILLANGEKLHGGRLPDPHHGLSVLRPHA